MPVPNPFGNNMFELATLCAAIQLLPNKYDLVERLGIFPEEPVYTRQVWVDREESELYLLPTKPWGSPGTKSKSGDKDAIPFQIPHIPVDALLTPDAYNQRAFGMETELTRAETALAKQLQFLKNKIDVTKEWFRCTALRGVVQNPDGTVIYNLFTAFGITEKTVIFEFSSDTTDVWSLCQEVVDHIDQNAKGQTYKSVRALVSKEFYNKLVTHPKVKEYYLNWQGAATLANATKIFEFGGIEFEKYLGKGSILKSDGTSETKEFIPKDTGQAFPMGAPDFGAMLLAPGDFNEVAGAGLAGAPIYSFVERRAFGRGYDIHAQSNPLPLVYRPAMLVKLTMS